MDRNDFYRPMILDSSTQQEHQQQQQLPAVTPAEWNVVGSVRRLLRDSKRGGTTKDRPIAAALVSRYLPRGFAWLLGCLV